MDGRFMKFTLTKREREKEKTEYTLILVFNDDVEGAKAVCMHIRVHIHNLCIECYTHHFKHTQHTLAGRTHIHFAVDEFQSTAGGGDGDGDGDGGV